MHCGPDIIKGILGSRAINKRVQELSVLGYYIAQACIKADEKERLKLTEVGKTNAGELRLNRVFGWHPDSVNWVLCTFIANCGYIYVLKLV